MPKSNIKEPEQPNQDLIDLWQKRATRKQWESNIIKQLMDKFEGITLFAVENNDEPMARKLWELTDIFMEWSEMLHGEKQDEADLIRYIASIAASLDTYNNIIANMTILNPTTICICT